MTKTNNLPAELRETGLFCVWRREERDGKLTKVPYNPRTGGGAQSNNPATFAPLDVALASAGGYDGLGLGVFGDLGAIDIDHCIDEDGAFSELAAAVMSTMGSYTEKSPSGSGVRILFKAPGFQYDKEKYYIKNSKSGLEVYIAGNTKRFVTVTGDVIADCGFEKRTAQLLEVLDRFMLRPAKTAPAPRPVSAPSMDDAAIIERAKAARNGSKFSALWAGDTIGYSSASEADQALCNILAFWTNRDMGQMDRLFRQSGLMREKWDRRQSGSTYGAITIQKAIADCSSGYDPEAHQRPTAAEAFAPEQKKSFEPPDYSDAGNAEIFVRENRERLIFVDALGWLFWNGKKWERDDHRAMSYALELSRKMYSEAMSRFAAATKKAAEVEVSVAEDGSTTDEAKAAKKEKEAAKGYLSHAKQTRNAVRIKNMMELSKPALHLKADRLDADPFDLNTPAGIVNLRDGSLRPHDRKAYCSQITETAPGCGDGKMWNDFLDLVTCGDGGLLGFLQTVAGMALIGAVYHEGIVMAYGGGRNGKSTFFNALGRVVGDYGGSIDIQTITTDRGNKMASLATLRGKRLVVTGELEEHQRLSVATVKALASTDNLVIEEKFKQPETIRQTHTLVLFTNHLPRVGSTDSGTWRRLIVAPFKATIQGSDAVQNFADVLAEKAGGAILAWAIEGAKLFAANRFKLDIPDVVEEATDEYREREDWLTNFINERCVREPNERTQARELYRAYKDWAEEAGDYVRREREFSVAMETAGFQSVSPKNRRYWVGLRLDQEAAFRTYCGATG